ncbi:hypothetical protein HDU77_010104 [Chytriomyces hyalinus]|nr:hypothetical protein HDU77_010104 [Chytriomyces hyalinus]
MLGKVLMLPGSIFCAAEIHAFQKPRPDEKFYNGATVSQSRVTPRELTSEEMVAWADFMAHCESLGAISFPRLIQDKASIFEAVQLDVLIDFEHCINFLMSQSEKEFNSGLQWFRVPPTPADLQSLTSQGFELYASEAAKRGQVMQPNLVATYLKRLLNKVHAGVVTPSMQAFIAEMKASEASGNETTSTVRNSFCKCGAQTYSLDDYIAQILKLNPARHRIVKLMSRLAFKILQVDGTLSTKLAAVMPVADASVSDAQAAFMAKRAVQVAACEDAERDISHAAAVKEMNDALWKWHEVVGWMYLHPDLLD